VLGAVWGGGRSGCERPGTADLVTVRSLLVRARCLEQDRKPRKARFGEERGQAFVADFAFADVLVTVLA